MRLRVAISFLLCLSVLQLPLLGSQPASPPVSADAQALTILQQSVATMGSSPSDSTASGSVSLVAGSDTQTGSIQIQTRGTDQSREQITTGAGTKQIIFSRGFASDSDHTATKTPY